MQCPAILAADFRRHRGPGPDAPPAPHDFMRRHRKPNAATLVDPVITRCMSDVARVVTRIANAADSMPNNPILGELAGGRGRSSVLRALRRLHKACVIRLETSGSRRRVHILATGAVTAWGEARPGHSPYARRPYGTPAAETRPRRARTETSRPLPPQLPPISGVAVVLVIVDELADLPKVKELQTCQFPKWEDAERPRGKALFCGAPAMNRSDFCPACHALCYKPSSKRGRKLAMAKAA